MNFKFNLNKKNERYLKIVQNKFAVSIVIYRTDCIHSKSGTAYYQKEGYPKV